MSSTVVSVKPRSANNRIAASKSRWRTAAECLSRRDKGRAARCMRIEREFGLVFIEETDWQSILTISQQSEICQGQASHVTCARALALPFKSLFYQMCGIKK